MHRHRQDSLPWTLNNYKSVCCNPERFAFMWLSVSSLSKILLSRCFFFFLALSLWLRHLTNNINLLQCLHFLLQMHLIFFAFGFIPPPPPLHTLTLTKGHENRVNPSQFQWNLTQRQKTQEGVKEMQHLTVAWPPPVNTDAYAPDTGRAHHPAQS